MTKNEQEDKPEESKLQEGKLQEDKNAPRAATDKQKTAQTGIRAKLRQYLPKWALRWSDLFIRFLLEASSAALTVTIMWFVALAILMGRPSVDLKIFKPHYENWFKTAFSGKSTTIEDYAARWVHSRQTIEIIAKNIVITGEDDSSQVIENVIGEFELGRNLLSMPKLTRLRVDGGALTVKRRDTGTLLIGLGTPETFERVGPLWVSGGDTNNSNQNLAGLIEHVDVASAQIYWQDDLLGQNLAFDNVNGSYYSDGATVKIDSIGVLNSNDKVSPVSFALVTTPQFDGYTAQLSLKDFRPEHIAPQMGRFKTLRNLDAPVDLKMGVVVLPGTGLKDFSLDLTAGKGRLKTGATFKSFESAEINAVYNAQSQNVDLTKFSVNSHALTMTAGGKLDKLGTLQSGFLQSPVGFDLNVSDIFINPGQQYDGPISIKKGQITGALDPKKQTLNFDKFGLDFGDFQIDYSVFMQRGEVEKLSALNIDGEILGVPKIEQILSLWPHNLAPNTRAWTVNTVKSGEFSNIKIHVAFDEQDMMGQGRANDHMNISYDVANADIKVLRQMPLLKNMTGRAVLQGDQSDFYLSSGTLGDVIFTQGTVHVPKMYPMGTDFVVEVQGRSQIPELLRVSNFPPLELAKKFGVSPDIFSGNGAFKLTITQPLSRTFDLNAVRYEMSGEFENVSFPLGLGAQKIHDGKLAIAGNNEGLTINGPMKIGKWQGNLDWQKQFSAQSMPAQYKLNGTINRNDLDAFGIGLRRHLGGDIDVELSGESDGLSVSSVNVAADFTKADVNMGRLWSKLAGEQGQLTGRVILDAGGGGRMDNINISAKGLQISGALSLAANLKLRKINLDTVIVDDFINARIQAEPTQDGVLSITVSGAYLNAQSWVDKAFKTQSSAVSAPMLMTGNIDKMRLDENYELENAQGVFMHDGQSITEARLQGKREAGNFLAEIRQSEDKLSRVFHVDIPDASTALLTLLGLDTITGGTLKIDGNLPLSGAPGGISGVVQLQDFTLVRAPAFAQILSLASLQGLADTLGGSGLSFNNLDLTFALENGLLRVREGRASGPALGLTAEGDINLNGKIIDFNGVVVPSYTVNSILGDIPLLGDIVVGKKGEGMFALNYTVKGPYSTAQVAVNPLSALTPGFLRRIFDVKREKITDPVLKDMIEEQKIK